MIFDTLTELLGQPWCQPTFFLKQPDIITQFIFCTDDSTAGMWCPSKPYKYSNCDSHHIVYGENEVGLFFSHNRGCLKYLLPLCNSISFSKKAWGQTVMIFFNLDLPHDVPAFTLWCPPPYAAPAPTPPPESAPAQYSPCHSPCLCLYSHGPHTAAWVLGEHAPSPLSCHCAPQCQILSGKGPGPRPCCYFWPGKGGESKWEKISEL